VSHNNIVRLLDHFDSRDYLYMCFEYNNGCTLAELIQADFFLQNELIVREFAYKVAIGLEYLHDNGIVLRNMSPKQIYYTNATEGKGVPRLSKFNKAVILGPGEVTYG